MSVQKVCTVYKSWYISVEKRTKQTHNYFQKLLILSFEQSNIAMHRRFYF
jgi:hypothetical protein